MTALSILLLQNDMDFKWLEVCENWVKCASVYFIWAIRPKEKPLKISFVTNCSEISVSIGVCACWNTAIIQNISHSHTFRLAQE